jgi:very-short-patch-repair endonuclease/predicted transcriptional regulator of viral defense system
MGGERRPRLLGADECVTIGAAQGHRRAVAEIAAHQLGNVTREQLRAAGLSDDAIDNRLRAGRLHRLFRGVYLVGHDVAPTGALELASVLACGDDAYVSHASAARLHGLPSQPHEANNVEVTVIGRKPRPRRGIRVHYLSAIQPDEIGTLDGIPITSPGRTILDLASRLSLEDLERLIAEAHAQRVVAESQLRTLLSRHHGARGSRNLRHLLERDRPPARIRSRAERRLLALLRDVNLPAPEVNVRLGKYVPDFLWRDQRVIVEFDGFRFHSGRTRFDSDRRRDQDLAVAGYIVLRVTWRQLTEDTDGVAKRLAAVLQRASTPAP